MTHYTALTDYAYSKLFLKNFMDTFTLVPMSIKNNFLQTKTGYKNEM